MQDKFTPQDPQSEPLVGKDSVHDCSDCMAARGSRCWERYWQLAALFIAAAPIWSPWQGTGPGLLAVLGAWGLFAVVAAWRGRAVAAKPAGLQQAVPSSQESAHRSSSPSLLLLQCCTKLADVCGVGVLVRDLAGWKALNGRMERILEAVGDASILTKQRGEGIRHRYTDSGGRDRTLQLSVDDRLLLAKQVDDPGTVSDSRRGPFYDLLTDLPNRLLLLDRLRQAMLTASREEKPVALLVLGLNRFRDINDSLGHHIGDAVLSGVAGRLRDSLRRSDTVARVGGDEFAVLLPGAGADHARAAASKLLQTLAEPLQIQEHRVRVGVSVGMALYPQHGDEHLALLRRADVAMYVAKRRGLPLMVYDPEHDPHTVERLTYLHNLREAIDTGQFVLYFQPKVGLDSGQVGDVEALVRWQHPKHGIIGPDRFIPLAEQTGLIRPLTELVLDKALQQCAAWRDQGLDISVAVNISATLLQVGEFSDTVAEALKRWELPPKSLILEITETSIMDDPALALKSLSRFGAMGVRLSIDDFGTGYSSMLYLKQLPVNELKIDKSFVLDMHKDDNDRIIVRATVDLAHNLGLKVIAEGVETERTRDMLAGIGCDMVQGFYYSRPLSAERFGPWLRGSSLREKAWMH